jgi:hypothetical protein
MRYESDEGIYLIFVSSVLFINAGFRGKTRESIISIAFDGLIISISIFFTPAGRKPMVR